MLYNNRAEAHVPQSESSSEPVFLNSPEPSDLWLIVARLNDEGEPERRAELRQLILRWKESGNLQEMLESDVELWKKVQTAWKPTYLPSNGQRAHLALFPEIGHDDDTPRNRAILSFALFTLIPEHDRLAVCPHCGKYFVRETARRKIYCRPECGSAVATGRATGQNRREDYEDKLDLAFRAIQEFERLPEKRRAKLNWKEWVVTRARTLTPRQRTTRKGKPRERKKTRDLELTVKWLSRVVNAGALQPPQI
jgi:Family of unknown function (DUF6076)